MNNKNDCEENKTFKDNFNVTASKFQKKLNQSEPSINPVRRCVMVTGLLPYYAGVKRLATFSGNISPNDKCDNSDRKGNKEADEESDVEDKEEQDDNHEGDDEYDDDSLDDDDSEEYNGGYICDNCERYVESGICECDDEYDDDSLEDDDREEYNGG